MVPVSAHTGEGVDLSLIHIYSPYMKLRSSTLLMQMMISISEACLRKADMLGAHGGTSAFVVQKMIRCV